MVLRKYVFKHLMVEKLRSLAALVAGITRMNRANVQTSLKKTLSELKKTSEVF